MAVNSSKYNGNMIKNEKTMKHLAIVNVISESTSFPIVEGDRPVESEQLADARKQRRFKRLAVAHQHVAGSVEPHRAHGLEVDIEQLARTAASTQPTYVHTRNARPFAAGKQ